MSMRTDRHIEITVRDVTYQETDSPSDSATRYSGRVADVTEVSRQMSHSDAGSGYAHSASEIADRLASVSAGSGDPVEEEEEEETESVSSQFNVMSNPYLEEATNFPRLDDPVQVHRFPTEAAMRTWGTSKAVEASREGKQVLFVTPNDSARSALFEHWNDQVEGRVVVAAGGHEEIRRWRGQTADFVIVESANDLSADVVQSVVDPILNTRPEAKLLVLGRVPYGDVSEGSYFSTQMAYDIPHLMHKENE